MTRNEYTWNRNLNIFFVIGLQYLPLACCEIIVVCDFRFSFSIPITNDYYPVKIINVHFPAR